MTGRKSVPVAIREEAAQWFARNEALEGAAPSRAFEEWLARDLRHRLAYAEIERDWHESLALAQSAHGRQRQLTPAPLLMRRSTHFTMATLACFALVGLISVHFSNHIPLVGIGGPVEARTFDTAPGRL